MIRHIAARGLTGEALEAAKQACRRTTALLVEGYPHADAMPCVEQGHLCVRCENIGRAAAGMEACPPVNFGRRGKKYERTPGDAK